MVLHVKQVSPTAIPQMCILIFTPQAPPPSQSCSREHKAPFSSQCLQGLPLRGEFSGTCLPAGSCWAVDCWICTLGKGYTGAILAYGKICVCSCRQLINQPAVARCLRSSGITATLRAHMDWVGLPLLCNMLRLSAERSWTIFHVRVIRVHGLNAGGGLSLWRFLSFWFCREQETPSST